MVEFSYNLSDCLLLLPAHLDFSCGNVALFPLSAITLMT